MVIATFAVTNREGGIVSVLRKEGFLVGVRKKLASVLLNQDTNDPSLFNIPRLIQRRCTIFAWEMEYGGGQAMPGQAVVVCNTAGKPFPAMRKPLINLESIKGLSVSGHFYLELAEPFIRITITPNPNKQAKGELRSVITITRHHLTMLGVDQVLLNTTPEFSGLYRRLDERLDYLYRAAQQAGRRAKAEKRLRLYFAKDQAA